MSPNKLTDTQFVLLSAASKRDDGAIDLAGNRKSEKLIRRLLNDGLVKEVPASGGLPTWRHEDNQGAIALQITERGLGAIGVETNFAESETEAPPAIQIGDDVAPKLTSLRRTAFDYRLSANGTAAVARRSRDELRTICTVTLSPLKRKRHAHGSLWIPRLFSSGGIRSGERRRAA